MNDDVGPAPSEDVSNHGVVKYYADNFSAWDDIAEILETASILETNAQTRFKLYTKMAYARGYVRFFHNFLPD